MLACPKVGLSRIVIAYGVFLAALLPFLLWAGRGGWFLFDDWDYLVRRKAGNLGDLVRPHNGHWVTIPIIVYRALWSLFGLSYRPYQLVSIISNLVGVLLLLVVMLRARTRPWLAVMMATLVVFFGDAQPNVALIVTSITFAAFALPLGLMQLLLADHEGALDYRDWPGLGAALCALLCSSVAITMLFVVGVAVAIKRGWRRAAFHVLPPIVIFSVWYAMIGRNEVMPGDPAGFRPLGSAIHFASILLTGTFESLTRAGRVGIVFVVVLLVGLFLSATTFGQRTAQGGRCSVCRAAWCLRLRCPGRTRPSRPTPAGSARHTSGSLYARHSVSCDAHGGVAR